jgi:hypothetical protein
MCKAKRFLFPNPKTMQPFLALITPLSAGAGEPGTPTHPIVIPPEPPVGIWPSPGHPAHPIAPGGPPPTVSPPIYYPPSVWPPQPPVYPAHPIAPGGPPPYPAHPIVIPPDAIAPGVPSHPIYWPIEPTHPIAPGGAPPTPTHPIVIPGDDENKPKFEVKTAWSPQTGWIVVIVPGEEATIPTPSEAAPPA